MKILVMSGPNLNLLGVREPQIYGTQTYANLTAFVQAYCEGKGIAVDFYQSNHEGDLVDAIQTAWRTKTDGIILNAAAHTHTSIALLDALKATAIPTVEVHLSKVEEREDFRQISYIKGACIATISGKGFAGYTEAVDVLENHLK